MRPDTIPPARNAEGVNLAQTAINLYNDGVFPKDWRFVPVHGKATYVEGWATDPLNDEQLKAAFKSKASYRGLGVVTGSLSGGLITIDIDGPLADARFKAAVGDAYEAHGQESTMSWTSGKEGRRQIAYRLPAMIVPELAEVSTVLLDEETGEWLKAGGDASKNSDDKERKKLADEGKYEEVVIRINFCQSVLPGSPHPKTGNYYHFLNYNHGKVEDAPEWLVDVLRPWRQPVSWLSKEDQQALDGEHGETSLPAPQIRGWFFSEEVQDALMPRLTDLVFKNTVFDQYGWIERGGRKPQLMSGCPWHESVSGTAFQVNKHNGCWDCKACGVGGDVLDFVHKIKTGDKHAPRPMGADLESIVADLAKKLGYDYPSCANKKNVNATSVPRVEMSSKAFHEALIEIYEKVKNPAEMLDDMARLAADTGRRLSGTQCLAAMDNYRYYKVADAKNQNTEWWKDLERSSYVIPNLLKKPTQVILHAAGGLGKTSACMGLARIVGRGLTTKIRGIDLPVEPGKVLWIQNDQSQTKLLDDMEDNGIDPEKDKWFVVRRHFQMDHTHRLREWIKEIKPALVVIDSIGSCSTKMQVEEKDKAFANPLYWASDANGDLEEGFPACCIVWIHHDNAQGGVRGTRYLVNAVDEQWHLRAVSETEREYLRSRGHNPSSCRVIEIKKSRMGRQGDTLAVERDQDFRFSVWDLTPTERREDNGQGDPDPMTSALRIVRDRVKEVSGEEYTGSEAPWMTAQEVWEKLVEEVTGLGGTPPSCKTVKRWLDRWVREGVLQQEKKKLSGEKGGRPTNVFTLPLSPARCPSVVQNPLDSPEIDCAARDEVLDTKTGVQNLPGGSTGSEGGAPEHGEGFGHAAKPTEFVQNPLPPENASSAGEVEEPVGGFGQRTLHAYTQMGSESPEPAPFSWAAFAEGVESQDEPEAAQGETSED